MPPLMAGIASFLGIRSSRPEILDDEGSEVSAGDDDVKPKKAEAKAKNTKEEETLMVELDNEEDDDDDEVGEDEYVVEQILSHIIDEEGVIKYEVKWEGFEKKTDRTWEPEENLETAPKILEEYLARIGGKEALLEAFNEKKPKGKKRGRASTTTESGVNGSKRGKKNGAHPASSTPPASAKSAEFKPPSGNWEEEVVGIDACEGNGGNIVVYLTWKSGEKSQHPLHQVYKRCPQKMLKFYESHLVFKKNDDEGA